MKSIITTLVLIFVTAVTTAQQHTVSISDFESVDNTSWKGTLTYKDYQSGEQETIDATMQFKIDNDKIISTVQYTYEPNKNHKSTIKIRKNGTYFGNEKVLQFTETKSSKTLVTTYEGRDNGKKADMFITHVITDTTYTVTKEVSYKDSDEKFTRNTYKYTKL